MVGGGGLISGLGGYNKLLDVFFCWQVDDLISGRRGAYKWKFKTESIRKLSNFNFQWTKTLCQNTGNLNNISLFFLQFSRATGITSYL